MAVCLLAIALLFSPAAHADNATAPIALPADNVPITITADKLIAGKANAQFEGNVVVRRGTVTLTCDKLEAEYETGSREVRTLKATGHVRIVEADRVAMGEEAAYDRAADLATLTGSPVIHQGDNSIKGEKILFRFGASTFEVVKPSADFTPPPRAESKKDE